MDLGIRGKVAMVAAASKGIGFAIAQSLANEGCQVSLCSRSADRARAAADLIGGGCQGWSCDVSNAESIYNWFQSTRSSFGDADILVTNTGGPPAGAWTDMSDEHWQDGFESTLLNVVRMVRHAETSMRKRRWGRIVHLTSVVAREPSPLLPISSTLRAGLNSLTRLQASELAPYGVTVNALLPGHTLTDRQRHLASVIAERDSISQEEAMARQGRSVPLGRLADPSEIGAAAAFLCSTQAAYITGVSLLVDGGMTRMPG